MNNKNILDLGCGRGAKVPKLEKSGKVTGIDISQEFIDNCRSLFPKSKFLLMNGENMTFPPNSFDEVYCLDVIEHVNDPSKLLTEIGRVLKINGTLYLDIPWFQSEKLFTAINPDYSQQVYHQNVFTYLKIIDLLNENNFKISKCEHIKFFDNIYLLLYFLKGKKIINQQGDFLQETKFELLISFIIQHLYTTKIAYDITKNDNYKFYDKISQHLYNLSPVDLLNSLIIIDKLVSPHFPKTISLKCELKNKQQNNSIDNLLPKKDSINLSDYSTFSQVIKLNQQIDGLKLENIESNNKNMELTQNLKIIKDSKLYKLWPIYDFIKRIFK